MILSKALKRALRNLSFSLLVLTLAITLLPTSHAAPNTDLRAVRAQVEQLQEDAAEAGENAQAAKIQLAKLKKQLSSVQQQADVQRQSVESIKKSLAAIAIARYKSTGLGEGLELLFSSDPSLYLSAAGSLENVTRKQAIELRKFATAKQLTGTPAEWMELAGQGLRDTTRIAGSDESLWKEIIYSNRAELEQLLINLQNDVAQMIESLDYPEKIAQLMAQGRAGKALIPGKHGGKAREYWYLPIVIDDKPGQLGAIFNECAAMEVNVEDLNIEHSPGQLSALITLALSENDATKLSNHLAAIGWNVHPIRK